MKATTDVNIDYRRAVADDEPAILALLRASLGWGDDPRFVALYRWKHLENAFGPSPSWVAVHDGHIVGLRTFMRWEFERDGQVVKAVRAVDTATHPDFQGRGIFRTLTMIGVDELTNEGVELVFNTPNDKSRPGYLKMGWKVVGRLPVLVRPRSLSSLRAIARARVAADHWSEHTEAGRPVDEVLGDLAELPGRDDREHRFRTRRTPQALAWRYGFAPLHFRVFADRHGGPGRIVGRLRRRGPATELAVLDRFGTDDRALDRVVAQALRSTGADYALRLHTPGWRRGRSLPLPGNGPILASRPLAGCTSHDLDHWKLVLGDVELF